MRLKKIDETRNNLSNEIKHNELISKKHKKTCRNLKHLKQVFKFCFCSQWLCYDSTFASLLSISLRITSYVVGLKMCALPVGIKNHKSTVNKKENAW